MLKYGRFARVIAAFLTIAACAGPTTQLEANGEPPSPMQVVQIAKQAYQNTYNRAPQNLSIKAVKYAEIFFSEQELVACVTTTEREQCDVFNNAGDVIITAGTAYTKNYIMLMRRYPPFRSSGASA